MRGFVVVLGLLLVGAAAAADDGFEVGPATEYAARQRQSDVTVAVKAYVTEAEQKEAFGKARPYKYGFVPVLVVITNDGDHPLALEGMKARFIVSGRDGTEPTSGQDLTYFNPKGHQPREKPSYIPIPIGGPKARKGPLAKPEITQREFQAPVVAPKTTASGFFYYETNPDSNPLTGASMYITGIRDMTTGQELFYFEIPLNAAN